MNDMAGQPAGIKLGRYYYEQGGKNKWMIALSQTAGFPLLFIPLFLLPSSQNPPTSSTSPSAIVLASFYFVLGVLVASETMLFSHGLSYLSASTYSLFCATQSIFVAGFAYFINSQKFTVLILNSMVVLSLFVALVAVNDNSKGPTEVSNLKYFIGFVCTLRFCNSLSFSISYAAIFPKGFAKGNVLRGTGNANLYTIGIFGIFSLRECN
ncbi:hypothetical protein TIFTF001_031112 [Ficus carica]|uniref:Uncharacterized protein n=1 Tax=Ficus carica TaxID=3494 RepID=A0AA88J0J5_FICCA|nr:hypothetical protein TIFTF001_031112 [Ficus carica]